MKILFCGGGTAGHISPAIALAEEFKIMYPSSKVAFVGRSGGSENSLITAKKYELFEIDICGLSRRLSIDNIKAVKKFLKAKRKSEEIIESYQPDAVIGTGGYVAAPVIYAAQKHNILTAIHESNAVPGLTTRLLSKKCKFIFLGANIKTKHKNAVYTGNPVSDRFGKLSRSEAKSKLGIPKNEKLIVSVGGSIGAGRINDTIIEFMQDYISKTPGIYHIHSSGKRYYDTIQNSYPQLCGNSRKARILPFIDDMPTYLSAADLVICRCGAMTLAEISKSACPSIMIPSPNVTGNHQMKNALYFQNNGAGKIIEEKNLCKEVLIETVEYILNDKSITSKMSKAAKSLYVSDSKSKIISLIQDSLHR